MGDFYKTIYFLSIITFCWTIFCRSSESNKPKFFLSFFLSSDVSTDKDQHLTCRQTLTIYALQNKCLNGSDPETAPWCAYWWVQSQKSLIKTDSYRFSQGRGSVIVFVSIIFWVLCCCCVCCFVEKLFMEVKKNKTSTRKRVGLVSGVRRCSTKTLKLIWLSCEFGCAQGWYGCKHS